VRKPRVAEFYPSVIAVSALAFVCTLAAAPDLASGQNAGIIDPGQSLNWQQRAPFFHNGSAATLADVVNFYDRRFNIGFTKQQKHDLANFLNTL